MAIVDAGSGSLFLAKHFHCVQAGTGCAGLLLLLLLLCCRHRCCCWLVAVNGYLDTSLPNYLSIYLSPLLPPLLHVVVDKYILMKGRFETQDRKKMGSLLSLAMMVDDGDDIN